MYPLVADIDITDAEGLKGAKIAVSVGTSAHYLLLTYLHSMGLTEEDIELVNTNDTVTLLASGEVQGAADQLAKFSSMIDAGDVHVLADGVVSETCQISAFVGRTEFCEKYPEITAKVLRRSSELTTGWQRAKKIRERHLLHWQRLLSARKHGSLPCTAVQFRNKLNRAGSACSGRGSGIYEDQ